MLYILSRAGGAFIQPSAMLVALALIGILLLARYRQSRSGFVLAAIGIGGLVAFTVLPIGTWLMRPLEDRFPPIRILPQKVDGVIVLGGAINLGVSGARNMPSLNIRAERMVAFAGLAHRYPEARLVFTGGNPQIFPSGPTEADIARRLLGDLGISTKRALFESKSRNTHENALFSRRLVQPKPGQIWLLVTSAADMPRAVGCFRAVGWHVVPYPVDYHTAPDATGLLPGMVGGLLKADWAFHEWIGLAYYRMRGWTTALFPAPAAGG